jgi:hypothetical protein
MMMMKMKGSSVLSRQITNMLAMQNTRLFATFSFDEAKQAAEQNNAAGLLKKVQKSEIAGSSDTEWLGNVIFAMGAAEEEDASLDLSEHADALDDFFRKNFRSLSVEQSMHFLRPLAQSNKIYALENKFWVWESLEEAIGGSVSRTQVIDSNSGDQMSKEDALNAWFAFHKQF